MVTQNQSPARRLPPAWRILAGLFVMALALVIFVLSTIIVTDYPSVGYVKGCTGVLVDENFYLTAAHCVSSPNSSFENGFTKEIRAHCVPHKKYAGLPPYFDVAVCKLDQRLTIGAASTGTHVTTGVTYLGYGQPRFFYFLTYPLRLALLSNPNFPHDLRLGTGTASAGGSGLFLRINGHGIIGGDSGGPVFQGARPDKGPLIGLLSCFATSNDPTIDNHPRAVNLTSATIRGWVDDCMRDFNACRTETRVPDTETRPDVC